MHRYTASAAATLLFTAAHTAPLGAQEMRQPGEVELQSHVVKPAPLDATEERIRALKLPAGFHIEKWAEGLKSPRVIVTGSQGRVYVSSRDEGTVTMLTASADLAHAIDSKIVLKKPGVHGLAIHDSKLYYITVKQLFSAPFHDDGTLGPETLLMDDLPDAGQHPNRTIALGPDGLLYISVGSTCNECDETNPMNAAMLRVKPDGSEREIFATGLRNTIGFAWQKDAVMYGMDDGVDWLGDDAQREEFNRIERGKSYGWPYIFGDGQKNYYREPKKGTLDDWDSASVRPSLTWTAHASSMQLVFNNCSQFPADYANDAFATMHGSWNRKPPSGYEVVRIHFENGVPAGIEPFATGFLTEENGKPARFARPFGLAQLADGSLLMGEDQNGIVYRIAYAPPQ